MGINATAVGDVSWPFGLLARFLLAWFSSQIGAIAIAYGAKVEGEGLLVTFALLVLTEAYLPDEAAARLRQLGNATLLVSCLGRFHLVLSRPIPRGIVQDQHNCVLK